MHQFIKIILTLLIHSQALLGQVEVVALSSNVGTIIDEDENQFYRIFPFEKDLINAQIIRLDKNRYRIDIVKNINGRTKKVNRYISLNEFDKLKKHVDRQPILEKDLIIAMYKGKDFLRAEKILNEIPKPQFINIKHSSNKKIRGTLLNVEKNTLYVQTAIKIEKVALDKVDSFSYRSTFREFNYLKPYAVFISGLTGFSVACIYNSQRPVIYNEYGIPRNDLSVLRQTFGIIFGLIFSSEVFDAISTLLTPTETIFLSEA